MSSNYNFPTNPQKVPLVQTKHRLIQTPIPAPGTKDVLEALEGVESRSMQGQMPIVWDKAKGWSVYDIAGNKWIDFTSTIFVVNIGHANSHLVSSVRAVLEKSLIHTYAYSNEIRVEYLKKLTEFAQFEKAFLLSSGTEATEAAVKLMRMQGQKNGKRKLGIICVENNWHGRTMGAQFLSSNEEQKEWIGFKDPNIHHIPFPYPWVLGGASVEEFLSNGLKKLLDSGVDFDKDICGVMLETFQGWGAVFYPAEFVQGLERLCRKHSMLLAFDEMQAGFARTGKRFGYEHYGVRPDLLCCGKGMGSGFPLSGVLGSKEVMDLPETGDMSSTHSANPVVCAAGLATIQEIESLTLVEESEKKGKIFHEKLMAIKERFPDRVSYVLGKGMIAAMLFKKPGSHEPDSHFPSKVCEICMYKGLLVVHTGRESIKLAPPLVISREALIEGLDVLEESIFEAEQLEK